LVGSLDRVKKEVGVGREKGREQSLFFFFLISATYSALVPVLTLSLFKKREAERGA